MIAINENNEALQHASFVLQLEIAGVVKEKLEMMI